MRKAAGMRHRGRPLCDGCFFFILLAWSALFFTACGAEVPGDAIPEPTALSVVAVGTLRPNPDLTLLATTSTAAATPRPTYNIPSSGEEPPADYAELIQRFTDDDEDNAVVLMGKFVKFIREDNYNRMYEDMAEPDPDYWNGVKLFEFQIESALLGTVKTRRVDIALLFREENLAANGPSIPFHNYMEPVLDQTYVIPLIYEPDLNWYINDMGFEPMWFKADNGLLVFETMDEAVRTKWASVVPITVAAFEKILE